MLPLLLLGAGLAGREYLQGQQRSAIAGAFREMMGSPREEITPASEFSPAEFGGGSGLLRNITDPTQAAYLQMLARMADLPGVTPQMLLVGAGRGVELAQSQRESGIERDFRAQQSLVGRQHQTEERVAGEQAIGERQLQGQDFQRWETVIRQQFEAAQQAQREAEQWKRLRYSEGQANWRHNNPVRSLPSGMGYYPGPPSGPGGGPTPILGPLPGTEQYVKGVEATRDARNAVENVDALLESYLLGGRGREAFGEEAGVQAARFQRLIRDVGKAADLGTLQKGDIDFLSQYLPDPTAFFNKMWQGDPRLIKIMETVRGTMASNYAMKREANPWVQGLGSDLGKDLPATPTAESVEKKFRAATERKKADAETRRRLREIEAPAPGGVPGFFMGAP